MDVEASEAKPTNRLAGILMMLLLGIKTRGAKMVLQKPAEKNMIPMEPLQTQNTIYHLTQILKPLYSISSQHLVVSMSEFNTSLASPCSSKADCFLHLNLIFESNLWPWNPMPTC